MTYKGLKRTPKETRNNRSFFKESKEIDITINEIKKNISVNMVSTDNPLPIIISESSFLNFLTNVTSDPNTDNPINIIKYISTKLKIP